MSEKGDARRTAVWVTSLHSGGCSACAQSIAALEAPRYARSLRAGRITLARSPRHSNVLLLCGALTEQARLALAPLIAGTPRPRALVAVGDCALNGCVFAGSPALTVPLAQAFEVNVEIGGCPPAPESILAAIAQAQRLLAGDSPAVEKIPTPSAELPAVGIADVAEAPELGVTPPSATETTETAASAEPDRAARLAALLAAAGSDWDDELDEDELDDLETEDGERSPHDTREHHLTGPSADSAPPVSQRRTPDE